jgi:hypothetical protein
VAVWPDLRDGALLRLFSSRFDGAAWSADAAVSAPAGLDFLLPVAAYAAASETVVAYEGSDGAVYASSSTDGGLAFSSFLRLDDGVDRPAALSLQPRIVADGGGNLWVSWLDESPGLASYYTRHSGNGGASFAAAKRLDRRTPMGGSESFFFPVDTAMASALPGAAFFAWAAERDSFLADALYNVDDLDDQDRDRFPSAADCNDADPAVPGIPGEVSDVALSKIAGGVRISWDPGLATFTDIASGLLSELRDSGGFGAASCLAQDRTGNSYDDTSAGPGAGEGLYYLLRGGTSCGDGSFGDSTLAADPRDALDAGATCD